MIRSVLAALLMLAPAHAPAQKDSMTDPIKPPVAEQRPHEYSRHGYTIQDPYHWLKDEGYPEVNDEDALDYLKAENAYFEAQMKPRAALVETQRGEGNSLRTGQPTTTVPPYSAPYGAPV